MNNQHPVLIKLDWEIFKNSAKIELVQEQQNIYRIYIKVVKKKCLEGERLGGSSRQG